jgi:tetratricopeptide (TPR) repeat protein
MPNWCGASLVCFVALFALRAPAVAQENRDLLKRSVVKIVAQKGSEPGSIAAGFLVGHRDERSFYIVTACHAVSGAQQISVWLETNRARALPAQPLGPCSADPFDVGVLVVEVPQGKDLLLHTVNYEIRDFDVRLGDTVFSMGHPNDLEWYADKHTVNVESDPGRTASFRVTRGEIGEGSSGGPIFDEGGRLAGMVSSITPTLALVIKIGPLMEKLREWDVALNMTRTAAREPGGRVILSDSLKLSLDSTDIRNTIASEVAAAVKGSQYSLVYMKPEELRTYQVGSRDALVFRGEARGEAFRLEASVVFTVSRVIRMLEQVEKPGDPETGPGTPKLVFPSKRFFRNQFLFSHFNVELDIPAKFPSEVRAAMARLVVQYAFAAEYFYGGDPQAQRWFAEVGNTANLLPAMNAPALGQICKAVSYYLAFGEQNPKAALEMLDLADRFDGTHAETDVIRTYLLFASGNTKAAAAALERLTPRPEDPAQLPELKGAYYMTQHDYRNVIAAFGEAARVEREPVYLAKLHLGLGLAYAALDGLSQGQRAAAVLLHSRESLMFEPRSKSALALEAFGGALAGDGKAARASLDRLAGEDVTISFNPAGVFETWFIKCFFVLPETSRAELIQMAGEPTSGLDSRLLAVVGTVLLGSGQASRGALYIHRAYALSPNDAEICELEKEAVLADGHDRAHLEKARDLLEHALDTGGGTPGRHWQLADVNQRLGDKAQESLHSQMACDLGPKDPRCFLWRGTLAVRASDFSTAKREFAAARALESDDADVRTEEGIVWQKAGRFTEALDAYLDALRLAPDDYGAHDNAGFVLFELDRFEEALLHFEAALRQSSGSADALGGKAITLEVLGRRDAALECFRLAVGSDRRVLEADFLKGELMWSDKALRSVRRLQTELSKHP